MRALQVMEATLGGTRRYLEDVSEALGPGERYGLVYSLHRADDAFTALLEKLRSRGWSLFELDMQREIKPLHDLKCAFELQAIYRSFRPDVVNAHSSKAGALARIATIGMKRRPAIVYTPHSIAAKHSRAYWMIEKALTLRVDVLAAVTQSEREELHKLDLLPLDRIRVVVPTIPSEQFAPQNRESARRDLGLGEGPIVVAIGRLTLQKDPLAFIDVASALRALVPDVRVFWVGDGELRTSVEESIAARKLESSVSITGWLEDVRPYVAASDVLVSTSRYESFGYATAEALAMERPVVASEITGTVDVVKRDMGEQLFPLDDLEGATARIVRFLSDHQFAAEIARRGREYVNAAFSVRETRRGLVAAYDALRQST
jgi:glycosyltransferase involved in cell wall biosynthesis